LQSKEYKKTALRCFVWISS